MLKFPRILQLHVFAVPIGVIYILLTKQAGFEANVLFQKHFMVQIIFLLCIYYVSHCQYNDVTSVGSFYLARQTSLWKKMQLQQASNKEVILE